MNCACGTSVSPIWKPGWLLQSGRIADLCEPCGLAYERFCFCETFHAKDTGWRACNLCQTQVHCGCIASIFSYILLDSGGIECVNCAKRETTSSMKIGGSSCEGWTLDTRARLSWNLESRSSLPLPVPWLVPAGRPGTVHWQTTSEADVQVDNVRIVDNSAGGMTSAVDDKVKTESDAIAMAKTHRRAEPSSNSVQPTALDLLHEKGKTEAWMNNYTILDDNVGYLADPGATKDSYQEELLMKGIDEAPTSDIVRLSWQAADMKESEDLGGFMDSKGLDTGNVQSDPSSNTCLSMSLGLCRTEDAANDACEQLGSKSLCRITVDQNGSARVFNKLAGSKVTPQRSKQPLVKLTQAPVSTRTEVPKDFSLQVPIRVARPPGEGRGKNQLLPRYWPRITDQELQQITSGDSNSTITPLFEKMLSASDAGRIGRLVLPKACAEAYFPTISQPEGLPLKIQDVTGKDWSFQFRFWPNNNSRMYVLEGVTPCIQSMQLQAGDTVTFSRLDPEGKLIMGYRRAPNTLISQDPQTSASGTQTATVVPMNSDGMDTLNNAEIFPGLMPHAVRGSIDEQSPCFPAAFNVSDTGYGWNNAEKTKNQKEGCLVQSLSLGDRKRGHHLGSKAKRPRLDIEDSVDQLSISWEEVQELLRPPPNISPSILIVDGHEFEEYEEPPIFRKQIISSSKRGSTCTTPKELEKEGTSKRHTKESPSGLEALANAATLGEKNIPSSSSAPTTKHPRHRPGCTCIVCIQPPSGKGPKHKPSCTCNVCVTVKRRFKTLMMRRKKKQSEQEAESVEKKQIQVKEEGELNSGNDSHNSDSSSIPENGSLKENSAVSFPGALSMISSSGNKLSPTAALTDPYTPRSTSAVEEHVIGKAPIDLNSQPERDDEPCKVTGRSTMMMLFQSANFPLERYLQQQGISTLTCPNQPNNLPMPSPENLWSTRMDDHASSQSAGLTSERPSDNRSLSIAQDKLDNSAAASQFLERANAVNTPVACTDNGRKEDAAIADSHELASSVPTGV